MVIFIYLNHFHFRMLWVLLFVTMSVTFVYFLTGGISQYLEYHVNTVIEYKRVPTMDFPSVTLCNINFMNKTYIKQLSHIEQQFASLGSLEPLPLDLSNPETVEAFTKIDLDKIGKEAAHTLEETFPRCFYNGNKTTVNPCQFHKDLFIRRMSEMGYCFIFNPSSYIEKYGPLQATRTGVVGGLGLTINIHQELYYVFPGSESAGMQLCILVNSSVLIAILVPSPFKLTITILCLSCYLRSLYIFAFQNT